MSLFVRVAPRVMISLVACLLLPLLAAVACGGGGSSGSGSDGPRGPRLESIETQVVDEGGELVLDLTRFARGTRNGTVEFRLLSGPGALDPTGQYVYRDARDADAVDARHLVSFEATERGRARRGEFSVHQRDRHSRRTVGFLTEEVRWIAYAPPPSRLDEASVRSDLRTLRDANFRGLVVKDARGLAAEAPRLAREEGFRFVVVRIEPDDLEARENALAARRSVDGYCIGRGALATGRVSLDALEAQMETLRRESGLPVTTCEPVQDYDDGLLAAGDWIYAHAISRDATNAVATTMAHLDDLTSRADRPVVLEVGMPSGGAAEHSEDGQNQVLRGLLRATADLPGSCLVHTAALDPAEDGHEHLGLYHHDGTPKLAARPQILFTHVPRYRSFENLRGMALNIRPENRRISIYIRVGSTWWMKPYWAWPLTWIEDDGSFEADVTTGGIDELAREYFAAIVTPDFVPVRHTLPSGEKVLATHRVSR